MQVQHYQTYYAMCYTQHAQHIQPGACQGQFQGPGQQDLTIRPAPSPLCSEQRTGERHLQMPLACTRGAVSDRKPASLQHAMCRHHSENLSLLDSPYMLHVLSG